MAGEKSACRLWLRWLAAGCVLQPVLALGHELVELGLVASLAQALEEFGEFLLLFLQPAQRVGPIFIKGVIAGRRRHAERPLPSAGMAFCLSCEILAGVSPKSHSSAPYQIDQNSEAERPEDDEACDHHRNPGRLAVIVQLCCNLHTRLMDVNCINIYEETPVECQGNGKRRVLNILRQEFTQDRCREDRDAPPPPAD